MKTPDEIKKGLEWCTVIKRCDFACPYHSSGDNGCIERLMEDSLTYIQQLEKRLADVNASPFDGGMSQAEHLNGEAGADG